MNPFEQSLIYALGSKELALLRLAAKLDEKDARIKELEDQLNTEPKQVDQTEAGDVS